MSEVQPRYVVKTLGCKANLYDSQVIENVLSKEGFRAGGAGQASDVEICIVNSCSVTDEADRQSRKLAQKLKRDYPNAKIVMTGCGAEVDPKKMAESKGVDFVIGNQDKDRFGQLVKDALERENDFRSGETHETTGQSAGQVLGAVRNYVDFRSSHPVDREWPVVDGVFLNDIVNIEGESKRTRVFLKIQEGCDSFCTYCIIPYGRGPSRSLRPRAIVDQIRALSDSGVREVCLTGTNIGDYGRDWNDKKPCFDELVETILSATKIERLRVSSLDPTEITPGLRALMATEPRFCPHFHVSLQSASNRVLKLMKRKYASAEVEECLSAIGALKSAHGPVFVGMDLITGFPGEGEAEFEETLDRLKRLYWTRLHVFPYSERSATPATKLKEKVDLAERKRRAKVLNDLSFERTRAFYHEQLRPRLDQVLVESPVDGPDRSSLWVSGYSPGYLRALVRVGSKEEAESLRNQVISVAPKSVAFDRQAVEAYYIAERVR